MRQRIRHSFWKPVAGLVIGVLLVLDPLSGLFMGGLSVARAADSDAASVAHENPCPWTGGGTSGAPANCGNPTPVIDVGPALQYALKSDFGLSLRFGLMIAALDALTYFTQTIAYDTAEWVANGFAGQSPGIFTDPFGEYTQNILLDSVGEFMGSFSENFTKGAFGLDLCQPPNFPLLSLEFALGLPDLFPNIPGMGRPRPKCAWTDIVSNWESSVQSLDNLDVSRNISANFSTGGSDLSFGMGAHLGAFDHIAGKREAAILERIEGQGFKPVKDFISGQIETPSQLAKRDIEAQLIENPLAAKNNTDAIKLNAAFTAGLEQMGMVAASTFTNVLITRLLEKVRNLLKSKPDRGTHGLPDLLNPFAAGSQATKPKELFQSQFSDLLTPRVTRTEDLDLLGELSACSPEARGRWHCTIDESFALALRQGALTVRQAIDQGFVNENWQLIPSTRLKDNQDPTCRSRAFCVANLRKMRLARLIPVGWELAADSAANQASCAQAKGCVTLREVISKFDDCSAQGQLDKDHPYCHLIDPNWVLTAFPAQCLTKGFSNTLFAGGRMEECQDTALCLERDKDGKCTGGYGYCMAEQTFWQFSAPSCQEQYASCRTYTPRGQSAKPVSYLRSTLDYGACNANNVGCMWYATKRLPGGTDADSAWDNGFTSTTDRVYFDKTLLPCDAKNDGCTTLRKAVAGGSVLNLIRNGSFERATGTPSVLEDWTISMPASPWSYLPPETGKGTASQDGAQSVFPPVAASQGTLVQTVTSLRPLRQYTLSFYARRYINPPENAGVKVELFQGSAKPGEVGAQLVSTAGKTYFRSEGCTALPYLPANSAAAITVPSTVGNEWTRFSCSFVTTPDTGSAKVFVVSGSAQANTPLIDAVLLEEAEVPTPFVDGLNQSLATVNMRIPPDELGCQGVDADHALCKNFARVCKQTEAGCQGYRAVAQLSFPEVPAVLTPKDLCPAECVGYAEFRKQPSTFDLVHDLDPRLDDPEDDTVAAFIPSTANSCSAQDVGCETFTNLEALALGGESEASFNYLRACEKPGPDSQTYYTWEGSDTTGYQLKTWSLKRDTTVPLPQPPKVIVKAGPDGLLKDPTTCNQFTYLQALDPDCRQFYDPEGSVTYRYESQTVLSTEDCRQFRKEGSTAADCTKTGGTFNAATRQCLYLADQTKSSSCDAANAGCRGYIGTQGKVQAEAMSEEFTNDPSSAMAGPGTTISQSDESVLVGDKSLKITSAADSPNNAGSIIFPVPAESEVLYELTFWAKTLDPARPVVTAKTTDQNVPFGEVQLEVDWKTYRMGPFTGTTSTQATTTQLTLAGFPKLSFVDKVRVSRVQAVAYVVKDSWDTPASCDQTPEGIPQPQAMLGCQAYVDRNQITVNARQFTRLCKDTAIGCTAYVNTRNTETPVDLVWEKDAPAEGTQEAPPRPTKEVTWRQADRYDYYIEEKSNICPPAQVSCRAFGVPQFTQDRTGLDASKPFKTVYLLDDYRKFDEGLCSEKELFCESYESVSGADYFRAPANHACEYRKAVVIDAECNVPNTSGATFDGWFKTGTTCPCHPDLLKGGGAFGIRYTGDPGYNPWTFATSSYRGWTATCPDQQAECTEFRDVADKSDPLHPLGRPYFVIKDDSLDTSSCNGQVDPARGCVLFRDLSDTSLTFSSAATNKEYKSRAYQPVAPLNCDTQPNHPSCQNVQKVCTNVQATQIVYDLGGGWIAPYLVSFIAGAACTTDNDCAWVPYPGWAPVTSGTCKVGNDTNLIVKVKPDRACSQWLACSSGETVYDPQEGKYKSICTDLQLCNKAGEPEGAGIPYCSNYVARDPLSGEMLRKNVVLNAATYATRPTGFGKPDYGGITIPDQFQLLDAELVPIGSIISSDPRVKSRYKKDYRLAVPVPYVHDETNTNVGTARKPTQDEKDALSGATGLKDRACVFVQNGSYGILEDTNGSGTFNTGDTCWLSMDQGQPPSLAGAGAPITADNLNVPNLATRFQQDTQPILDQVLSRSFPNTQCKAAPQGDAPFGNEFVIEWDDTVTPPKPKRLASGYASVNLCEYGEDCACTYKRVAYGGKSRFYGPLSTNVLNAMCVGGAKDGLPCVLDVGIKSSTAPEGTLKDDAGNEIKASDLVPKDKFTGIPPEQACGEGGTCQPISGVSLVRGVTGQCLQYDLARVVAGDQTRSECLVWSPTPVLAGPGDLYHWSPTAGWKPPISSGRYYCASPVQKPKTFQLKPRTETVSPLTAKPLTLVEGFGFRANKKGTYAGQISTFTYSDGIASDKSCLDFPNPFGDDCDGNGSGGSLDGHNSEGTDMGRWCEEADDDQSPSSDLSAVRLVTTGAGGSRSYAEYAVLLDTLDPESKGNIGRAISGSTDKDIIFENTLEDTIANFSFSTDHGKLGCEYSEDFGSVGGMDYDDRDSWYPQDKKWQANFKAEMAKSGNKLDRKNASIVTEDGSPSGIPVKVKCENPVNGETCFLKTWQLDYKAEGEDRFQAFSPDVGRLGMNALSESPVYGKCNSDHSWFSIRAVFEDSDPTENDKDAEEVTPEALAGPFQLIGFWVTTCSPHSGPRYIYMYVHMGTADVCRELAETISKDSHEATAFTDRNSERSGFAIPKSGFTWGTTNVPFGASLATRDAGKEPLYMDGVKQAASNPIHPPVFTFPGQTYFRAEKYPSSNWGMLSNVFARIYRIYGYYVRGVNRDSWACTNKQSPNFGQWCPNLDDVEDGSEKDKLAQKYCGLEAKCVSGGISGTNVFEQKACNSFSGVNRGLDCSIDPDICHKGPMELDEIDGILRPQYSSCNVYQGEKVTWEQSPTKKYWRCSGSKSDGCPDECNKTKKDLGCTRSEAMRNGAFRCSDSSVRGPSKILASADNAIRGSFCTKPADVSAECPMELQNEACIKNSASDAIGTCQSHPWAECNLDADCHFYARNFWPSGSENTTFVWSTGEQKNAGNWMESFKRGTSPASAYYGWPHNFATNHAGFKQNCSSDTDCPFKTAFPQEGIFEHAGGGGVPFFFHPIAAISSYGGVVYAQSYVPNNEYVTGYNKVAFAWDDRSLLKLYPGFSPMVVFKRNGIWCSANFGTDSESCDNSSGTIVGNAVEWIDQPASAAPYGYFQFLSKPYTPAGNGITYLSKNDAKGRLQIHYGACEPLALMAREGTTSTRPSGTCRGGARSGAVCQTDVECRPTGMKPADYDTLQADSINWCNPVTSGLVGGYSKGTENADCWPGDFASNLSNPNHPKKQEDPELDSNICTHPPGYWPRPNYCLDPNDEYCGLFGYDLNTAKLAGSVNDGKPLPTDVTPGLYTPAFLNPGGKTATPKTVGNSLDYNYVEFYNPAPPQVAAPDMRTCTGGQCRVSGLGTIGMDGLNEGVVNGGAGGHVATLRFYAWASHDQMPLRRVVVDWGDGNRTELPDAFMKNRKPYCQTEKECTEAPGLTCESDADCPPGAGTCETYGTCAARPSVKCYKDAQCEFGGEDGTCNPRTYFGNDQDACDEQYFEFRHAYACLPGTMAGLTSCGTTGHCSGDLNRTCTTAANCADGDRCVSNMAPINGCKDAVSNTCRFTPRVLITDNWGWCSGECRGLLNQSGVLVDVSGSPIRHPNGGCFDASRIRSNADFVTSVGPNECDVSNPKGAANSSVEKRYRPWIVFPGSIQLLTGETQ